MSCKYLASWDGFIVGKPYTLPYRICSWVCCLHVFKAANLQTARVVDGKSIARSIRSGIASEINQMKEATGKSPGLALVLVGKRRDSQTFIQVKLKACHEVGIATFIEELPEECTEDELLHVVSRLNGDPSVHGIIVQLPLPKVILQLLFCLLSSWFSVFFEFFWWPQESCDSSACLSKSILRTSDPREFTLSDTISMC